MRALRGPLPAVLLLAAQIAIVTSIAGKYLYERHTRPRVWVRTAQFDPNLPLRGRYLGLQLAVDACALPRDAAHFKATYGGVPGQPVQGYRQWTVALDTVDGHLVPRLEEHPRSPEMVQELTQWQGRSCEAAQLSQAVDYFISDTAKTPFPLKKGEELWVEVTVPKLGPPRAIQLALSGVEGFKVLRLD